MIAKTQDTFRKCPFSRMLGEGTHYFSIEANVMQYVVGGKIHVHFRGAQRCSVCGRLCGHVPITAFPALPALHWCKSVSPASEGLQWTSDVYF